MKLLTKLNIRYILFSVVVLAISGIAIYFILSIVINRQMEEQLAANLQRVENQLAKNPFTQFLESFTEIQPTNRKAGESIYSDTLIFNEQEQEMEEFRQIETVTNLSGENLKITIRKSKIESDDLLETLALVTLFAMILLTSTLILVNRSVAKQVWLPFFNNLKIIEKFSVNDKKPVLLEKTGISEFEKLNTVLAGLTGQIKLDYKNLKQFTEDVSHELQTPVAIIRSKLETLINDSELSEKQANTLQTIYSTANRLARLNKSLILLAKIENLQFPETSEISLQELINEKLNEWQELMELKQIIPDCNFLNDIRVKISSELAEILISNLISNAINHNVSNGKINIILQNNQLIISNSGKNELANPGDVFTRFYKENSSSKSLGLGLAIVKKICDTYSISMKYSFKNRLQAFSLTFHK